jgi:YVTN family beta-propeller protein
MRRGTTRHTNGLFAEKTGEQIMTTSSANKPGDLVLTSILWVTGFFFATSALYGAHAEQHNLAKATTFGYVTNVDDNTVSVIDTASNTVVATIPVGGFPDGVATTPDGTHAYVTNAFDSNVSVIDTASNTVVATIPVGSAPNGVAITPDGPRPYDDDDRRHQPLAYVTNGADNTVSVIDTASRAVVGTIPVGQDPTGVAITSDGIHAYVTNHLDDSVSVIDTARNTVVATIPGFILPIGVAITPDGTEPNERDDRRQQSLAYATNNVSTIDGSNFPASAVSVIDTGRNTVVATIPVGQFPKGVAIPPDGTHAYVANQGDGTVSVIDTARNKVVATIRVGAGPVGVAITSDGTHPSEHDDRPHQPLAYVTNLIDNTVSVIDTVRNKVVATIPVGTGPFAVTFATVTPSPRSSEQ